MKTPTKKEERMKKFEKERPKNWSNRFKTKSYLLSEELKNVKVGKITKDKRGNITNFALIST